jgi:HK97 family phage major capsid protein
MYQEVQQKREERARLVSQARELIAQDEISKEDEKKFDGMMADADTLQADIARHERVSDAEASLQERVERKAGRENISKGEAERDLQAESQTFWKYMKHGMTSLTHDEQQSMQARFNSSNIQMAQSVGTDSAGGYLVPEDFSNQVDDALKAYGGMRQVGSVFTTATGAALPWPTNNSTAAVGELLAENAAAAELDVAFGVVTFNAYMYSSKMVKVSRQLIQDSAFDLEVYLRNIFVDRIGRIQNTHFTTGTGSSQPNGVVTASALGKTGASGQTTSVIVDDLIDLVNAVDPAYRPGAVWMMHDNTMAAIRKLKDSQNRPLWEPNMAGGNPDQLYGYPVVVNQDVDTMAASKKSILFGDCSKYMIRDVAGMTMLRLEERFADNLQVAFLAFQRSDGDLLDAGTNPVKHYKNAAS